MNEQWLERKLEVVRAEIGDLPYRELKVITTGCEKDVVILDQQTVLSFFRDGLQTGTYDARQELIRRLAMQSEAVLPVCRYRSQANHFAVETYVPGERITPRLVEENPEEGRRIGRAVGSLLRQLHRMPVQGLGLRTGFAKDVSKDMESGLKLLETKLSASEFSQVLAFLNGYDDISAKTDTCVVHGDFHFDNILWDSGAGRLGVLDFGEAGVEDPALDFMYIRYYREEFRHAVFEAYGSEDSRLYDRSQMYDRIYGLYDMIENIQNDPRKPDFHKGYARFFES
jgi:aminoglycoside phosphotransferase (APT) family kinase protein